jgi:hypothetical protein
MTKRVSNFDETMRALGGVPCVYPHCTEYTRSHPCACPKHRCKECSVVEGIDPVCGWGAMHYWPLTKYAPPIPALFKMYPDAVCPTRMQQCRSGNDDYYRRSHHCDLWVQKSNNLCFTCTRINQCSVCLIRVVDPYDEQRRAAGFCTATECARLEVCVNAACPQSAVDARRYVTVVKQLDPGRPLFCGDCGPEFVRCYGCRSVYQLRCEPRRLRLSKCLSAPNMHTLCVSCLLDSNIMFVRSLSTAPHKPVTRIAGLLQMWLIAPAVESAYMRMTTKQGLTEAEAQFYLFDLYNHDPTHLELAMLRTDPAPLIKVVMRVKRVAVADYKCNSSGLIMYNVVRRLPTVLFKWFIANFMSYKA